MCTTWIKVDRLYQEEMENLKENENDTTWLVAEQWETNETDKRNKSTEESILLFEPCFVMDYGGREKKKERENQ